MSTSLPVAAFVEMKTAPGRVPAKSSWALAAVVFRASVAKPNVASASKENNTAILLFFSVFIMSCLELHFFVVVDFLAFAMLLDHKPHGAAATQKHWHTRLNSQGAVESSGLGKNAQ
jgi:hypothetical protein